MESCSETMALRDELAATRQALWAAIQTQGGRIAIPKETWDKFDGRRDRTLLLIFDGTGTRVLTTEAKKGGII